MCALAMGIGATAQAEDYNSAASRIANGYNSFFEAALKNGNQPLSNLSAAYETHVAEPSRAMTQVQAATSKSVLESAGVKLVKPKELDEVDVLGEAESSDPVKSQAKGAGTAPATKDSARAPAKAGSDYEALVGATLAPLETAAPEPAVVLDGNNIPKEIEFPGPPSPSAQKK